MDSEQSVGSPQCPGETVSQIDLLIQQYQHTYHMPGVGLGAGDPEMTQLLGAIVTRRVPGACGLGWGALRSDGWNAIVTACGHV